MLLLITSKITTTKRVFTIKCLTCSNLCGISGKLEREWVVLLKTETDGSLQITSHNRLQLSFITKPILTRQERNRQKEKTKQNNVLPISEKARVCLVLF